MMNKVDRWLLPDGIEEVLPDQARHLEALRRRLIDLFERWGYDYVIPPMVEFTDSLLTGSGQDIDLLTFKVTDQMSGKTLGIRADITPQAARMDAHSLMRGGVNRVCYAGYVMHTVPKSPLASRTPIKLGVEMFGVAELDAEAEVISLLLETLKIAELDSQYIDLGHVGVFRALSRHAQLSPEQERALFALLQSKALTDIDAWLHDHIGDEQTKQWFLALPRLSGSSKVIASARTLLEGAPDAVHAALDDLEALAVLVVERYPDAQLYFDLSELRGYHYHTGIVFGAFAPGAGNAIASGGRYDHVGEAFGRARAAAGFDIDLTAICRLLKNKTSAVDGIFAPSDSGAQLWQKVQELRFRGERVVVGRAGQSLPHDYQNCNRILMDDGEFTVRLLADS